MSPEDFLNLIKNNHSSQELDKILGLEESLLSQTNAQKEAYSDGLTGPEALYTSYQDLMTIREDLIERGLKNFADLGAGNCRSKILFDFLDSPFKSYAYEFVPERISQALNTYQSLTLKDPHGFIEGDLKEFSLEEHDAFFIYLPVGPTLESLIDKLKRISLKRKVILYVIESHGDLIDYLNDHLKALSLIKKYQLKSQRHLPDLFVFELNSCAQQIEDEQRLLKKAKSQLKNNHQLSLEKYNAQDKLFLFKSLGHWEYLQLLISEDHFEWLACLEGWQYGIQKDTIETIHPYRIHNLEKIKALIIPEEKLLPYIRERRDTFKPPLSAIRKIKIYPTLEIERANGLFEKL